MSVVVDTTRVAPQERFDFWAEAASAVFLPLRLQRRGTRPFAGRIWAHGLGPLQAFRIAADPSVIVRTPASIGVNDPETLQLVLQLRGRCAIAQGDRSTLVTAGQLSAYETSRPYRVEHDRPFEMLVFWVPKPLLGAHADRICARTAEVIPGDRGVGALAVPFLRQLGAGLADGSVRPADVDVAECLLDLVRALYVTRDAGGALEAPTRAAALLARVKAHIEEHLGDRELGPEKIAAAHYVSTRYLHRLFEDQPHTVAELIRDRRLERCGRDLRDPALAGETILSVATRWGLPNAAHFSRAFRATYGCSPSEYRGAGRG